MDCLYLMAVVVAICANGVVCQKYAKCTVKLDVSTCYSSGPKKNTKKECLDAAVCRKRFNISYVELQPYNTEIVADLLSTCCGPCVNSSEINSLTKVSEVSEAVMRESHIVFPVIGRPDTTRLYGYHFIPLIETPNVYYITRKTNNLLSDLIVSCLNMWPLLIITILMVMISGFLAWLTETWGNREEFPRTFLKGWFEGIWWSFISMTTVGYGDKAPKSLPARLFSIIWIVIGITTFSLVTAMLTTEITAANSQPPPTMENANVGVIRHRIYESILIANQGGILVDVKRVNITEGIYELVQMLDKKEIDGFVLDRYTLMLFYNFFENDPRLKGSVQYLRTKSVLTEIIHVEQFLYGILVKNDEDFEFLSDFMTSNRDIINTCNSLFLNHYSRRVRVEQKKPSLFSTEGEMFWPSFISCVSIIVIMVSFGALLQKKILGKEKKIGDDEDDVSDKGCGNGFLMS